MKIIGREVTIRTLFSEGLAFTRLLPRLFIVKHPFAMLKHYIKMDSPKFIDLKRGTRILLSSHPHDLITFFVIFLRKDYGRIKANSIVVDVGANIGIFSIYAALSGAQKVYAFEPSREAFQILCENIRANKLTDIIIPINKAVSDADDQIIKFPSSSSPYNRIDNNLLTNQQDHCEIQTITLNSFISGNDGIGNIDLLKLDCEGAEFEIIPSLDESTLKRIKTIRMECHGEPNVLIDYLAKNDYGIDKNIRKGHNLWLTRSGN